MDELVAYRIGGKDFFNHPNIYRFSELIRLKKEKLSKNTELLDFGIGEPLDMPSDSTLLSLINNSLKPDHNISGPAFCLQKTAFSRHFTLKNYSQKTTFANSLGVFERFDGR